MSFVSVRLVLKMSVELSFFSTEGHKRGDVRDSPAKDDIPNKGRNLLLSGLIAFSAMFGYAIAAGLVQVYVFCLQQLEVSILCHFFFNFAC